jgi:hypothetical protein
VKDVPGAQAEITAHDQADAHAGGGEADQELDETPAQVGTGADGKHPGEANEAGAGSRPRARLAS